MQFFLPFLDEKEKEGEKEMGKKEVKRGRENEKGREKKKTIKHIKLNRRRHINDMTKAILDHMWQTFLQQQLTKRKKERRETKKKPEYT